MKNDILKGAMMSLVYEQPFFASILLKRKPKETTAIPTMAVDKVGNIYYNAKWVSTLPNDELKFCLAHEVMHIVCMHALRAGSRDHELWNIAGDAYINAFLKTSGITAMPKGGVDIPGSEAKTTEQIYEELLQQQMQNQGNGNGNGEGNGKGNGQGDANGGGSGTPGQGDPLGHDIDFSGKHSEAELAEAEIQTKLDIADAAKVARMQGKATGSLNRLIDSLLYKKMPWYELLEKYFAGFTAQYQSWARPNRRFTSMGAYLPVQDHEASMGEVVIGIDTSGSIGAKELAYFGGHLNQILETCKPEKVYVVYCDYSVNHVDEFGPEEYPVKLEPHGGGGTDMGEICRWIEEQDLEPDCCVILTDGYTPFPDNVPCPTVWGITSADITAPVGETITVEWDE